MEYGKIIAVTGLPGLFELMSSKSDGAIVRSLDDKTTKFVSSRVHNFSHLESIEVYTIRENVNLADVFQAMEKNGEKAPDGKDAKALKSYFEKVYPDLDFSRVYNSDLKKMVKWFQTLKENEVDIKVRTAEEVQPTDEPVEENAVEAAASEEKAEEPKAKRSTKKKAEDAPAEPATEEAKPKKTTRKKKTEE